MKRLLLALGLTILVNPAQAQYFRLLDVKKPRFSTGAYVGAGPATQLALVTHSIKDGCAFPSIACLDWSPLAVGLTADRLKFGAGPSVNLSPVVKSGLLAGLNALTPDESFKNVKDLLAPPTTSDTDLTLAFGPSLVIEPWNDWFSKILWFIGGAWKF